MIPILGTLFGLVFIGIFVLAVGTILTGVIRHGLLAKRVFDLAQQQIEAAQRSGKAAEAQTTQPVPTPSMNRAAPERTCGHCGSPVPTGNRCPGCGAAVGG